MGLGLGPGLGLGLGLRLGLGVGLGLGIILKPFVAVTMYKQKVIKRYNRRKRSIFRSVVRRHSCTYAGGRFVSLSWVGGRSRSGARSGARSWPRSWSRSYISGHSQSVCGSNDV